MASPLPRLLATACLSTMLASGAHARQEAPAASPSAPPTPAPALQLDEVVASLLAHNTDLKLAGVDADLARGTLLVAGEPFEAIITSSAAGTQEQSFGERLDGTVPRSETRRLDLSAGVSKRLRAGVVVAPEVTASRTMIEGDPGTTLASASARLRVLLPLLRDLGGVLTEGPEQSARRFHAASLLEARHAVARGVLQAATSYWDYLSAQRRLDVLISSEARAERTARETGALVKADERTRTDRVQAEGHLAARRGSRISAEQDTIDAWEALATTMGIAGTEVVAGAFSPPRPTTEFPGAGQAPSAESLRRWLSAAVEGREDLQAARLRVDGTEVARKAARSELLPRLDLEVSAGYHGQERDRGWNRFLAPLHEDVPGLDAQVQLRFELPVPRSGARGRVTQASALHERQRLLALHLERSIRNGVAASLESVRRSQLALAQTQEAVRLLEQTVESERQKFRLGFSTLFAVIQAEEQLQSALLARIASQRSFAVSLARLRYETGTVLAAATAAKDSSETAAAVASALLVLP